MRETDLPMGTLRSDAWFARDDEVGLEHRASLRAAGAPIVPGGGRPVIALISSISELNPCNLPLRPLVEAAREGVIAAGGVPVEIPVMSLGEDLIKPTAMLYRNLLAMEVEENLRAQPIDGVVLFGNCDKTIPAELMAAASADLPAIQVAGGYRSPGQFRGTEIGAGTDLWSAWNDRRAGRLDDAGWHDLEVALSCSRGACNVMGTAMSMAILAEALGLMLPGGATLPAGDPRLHHHAYRSGRRIVRLVHEQIVPSRILTEPAFQNALLVLAAVGGSTNATVHLAAIAGRRAIRLDLDDLDRAARRTPVIADIAPIGQQHIAAFDAAGGLPAVQAVLSGLLTPDLLTVAATDDLPGPAGPAKGAIRPLTDPVTDRPAFTVLHGNLAPEGAVLKTAAADPALFRHTGPAIVFDSYTDMLDRIDDPDLGATRDSVLVLRGCGPRGGDGFPEWGMIPIPRHLAAAGVTDMLRISDARMSGTSFGTCVLHVAPDAASGGPLGLVRTGDLITIDVDRRILRAHLDDEEIDRRQARLRPPPSRHRRGWPLLYDEHVMQAPAGADFDFLVPRDSAAQTWEEPVIGRS
ncbi:dihydroxy-acid dehydratase [Actinoplanes sp. NBRC 103695]|uniref:dihydroxy-acid dehydratase n=1 Tax=Actinoplanes sp. NBRC 103695 TaxID=3032202 RepID=UPI0024A5152E|nr:dihydroxy-acid dehydratase [Actinoplanes sp. NBRC 103695]GLZ00992.1 dihydroxy-acid dehydratase [Actinoplanes sp. NBRC 103695]